ncbi:MAG: DUF1345 domain-containing protein [Alphaproteobacteria bacterium]|nr:DUF1345 domain-containing protein [Alphaproteobacteria bacterium]MBV9692738.1 DUF1345 domain-containing protein [Alphaproteobacteria bacterium]
MAAPRSGMGIVGGLLGRPYLMTAIAVGVAVYFASRGWMERDVTRALIGWDAGVVAFLCLVFVFMSGGDAARMKRRALAHDEGGRIILVLTILAAVASVGALVAELSAMKDHPGAQWHVALAAGTVVLSWLFVQVVFAIHYAHLYYLEEEEGRLKGGLEFGECGEPDYWDFFHFAIVLGATSQTADITFTTKQTRRVGTLHTLVAFAFNTAILATMINLAAGLF